MQDENAERMLKTAQMLRDAGILIFERCCWDDETWEHQGKRYRRISGCGSYFRWAHGLSALCPFCGFQYDYSQKFPYTNPELYPLTENYTGTRHELSEAEQDLLARFCMTQEVE